MFNVIKRELERKITIYDNRSVDKKPLGKKKNQKVVSLLKDSLRVEEITKQILDLNVNLASGIVTSLYTFSQKQLKKFLSLDEDVEFFVNGIGLRD